MHEQVAAVREDHRLVVRQAEALRQPDCRCVAPPGQLTERPVLHPGSMSSPWERERARLP